MRKGYWLPEGAWQVSMVISPTIGLTSVMFAVLVVSQRIMTVSQVCQMFSYLKLMEGCWP